MRFSWGPKWNRLIVILGSLFCIGLAWLLYVLVERPTQSFAARVRYGSDPKLANRIVSHSRIGNTA